MKEINSLKDKIQFRYRQVRDHFRGRIQNLWHRREVNTRRYRKEMNTRSLRRCRRNRGKLCRISPSQYQMSKSCQRPQNNTFQLQKRSRVCNTIRNSTISHIKVPKSMTQMNWRRLFSSSYQIKYKL